MMSKKAESLFFIFSVVFKDEQAQSKNRDLRPSVVERRPSKGAGPSVSVGADMGWVTGMLMIVFIVHSFYVYAFAKLLDTR